MSDNPTAYPPPPSPNLPPPPPGYPAPPPKFQAPAAPDHAQPYQNQPPPPYAAMGVAGAAGLMSQFTGRAAWSIGVGLVTIVAPFVVHWVFYVLALVGLLYGVQAIRRGQLIGGIIGIVLNVIGGLLTVVILTGG